MSAYVYRLYDDRGGLLYIGCANNVAARLAQHMRQGTGGGERIADWTAQEYPSRQEALDAEGAAIRAERPPFNQRARATGVPLADVGREDGDFASRLAWSLAQTAIAAGHSTLTLARSTGIPLTRLTRILTFPERLNVAEIAAICEVSGVGVRRVIQTAEAAA